MERYNQSSTKKARVSNKDVMGRSNAITSDVGIHIKDLKKMSLYVPHASSLSSPYPDVRQK